MQTARPGCGLKGGPVYIATLRQGVIRRESATALSDMKTSVRRPMDHDIRRDSSALSYELLLCTPQRLRSRLFRVKAIRQPGFESGAGADGFLSSLQKRPVPSVGLL